jgi:Na+/proline symporter
MIAGFATLAIVHFQDLGITTAAAGDFDRILPAAIHQFAPPGVLGLIIAGLLAAFVSTFAATLNAAPAYLVNDVYRRHINPNASRRRLIALSYAVSAAVVAISAVIGLYIPSINTMLIWIVAGLWGGYTAANVLKWYWWRLNGFGFFTGMLVGMVGALAMPRLLGQLFPQIAPDAIPLYGFPVLLLLSTAGCVVATLATPPDDKRMLMDFYRRVRPWGWWGPVRDAVLAEDPAFPVNQNFRRDAFNVVVGTGVQTALVALPIYVVLRRFDGIATCLALIAVGGTILKKTWYDRLASD